MKQHITDNQWNELGIYPKKKWRVWLLDHKYRNNQKPKPNIGQMIEFLADTWSVVTYPDGSCTLSANGDMSGSWDLLYGEGELCDSLWRAVKEILNVDAN